jgi:RNA polymerase sigma factor (sigma-70 family)
VCDRAIAPLLEGLHSPNACDAWVEFLDSYGPVLYQTARAYTSDKDAAADCYVYVCEQLAHNRFRRLLKFNPKGRAKFTTWLRVVARNLCFDWHRSQSGRHRPFKSLQDLSPLELEIYDWRFVRGASLHETLQQIAPCFPGVGLDELSAVEKRLQTFLSPRQRWILSTWTRSEVSTAAVVAGEDGELDVADPQADQETLLATKQEQEHLHKSLALLPADERLLLQLRFEHDLSLEEVARLCGVGDGQRVHRKIGAILKKLRSAMGQKNAGKSETRPCNMAGAPTCQTPTPPR